MASDYKAALVSVYAEVCHLNRLVETGTNRGDMIAAVLESFDIIYSIELSRKLYEHAQKRFASDPRVFLYCDDSSTRLEKILSTIDIDKTLVYLDAHYSGGETARGPIDTPILAELEAIEKHRPPVVLIDDADCFGRFPGYPELKTIEDFAKRLDFGFAVRGNVIRLVS